MAGAVAMIVVLVVVFPVATLIASTALAAVLGSSIKSDRDAANTGPDGEPNEYLKLSELTG